MELLSFLSGQMTLTTVSLFCFGQSKPDSQITQDLTRDINS